MLPPCSGHPLIGIGHAHDGQRSFPAPSCSATRRARKARSRRTDAGCPGSRPRTACSTSGWRRPATWARRASSPTTRSAASASTAGPQRHARALHPGRGRHRGLAHLRGADRGRRRRATSRRSPACRRSIQELSLDEPDSSRSAINDRDKSWHDLYRIDIRTGKRELLFENRTSSPASCSTASCIRGSPPSRAPRRAGTSSTASTAAELEPLRVIEHEDDLTTCPIGFTRDGTHALLDLLGRPRQGGAVRHATGRSGKRARAGRASQGRHRPRHAQPETRVVEAAGAAAPDARLDSARRAHRRRPQAPARRAARRGRDCRPDARRQPLDRRRRAPPSRRPPTTSTSAAAAAHASCSPRGPSSRPIGWRRCMARSSSARDGLELVSYLTLPAGAWRRARGAAADGAAGARRPVGARRLRLRPAAPVAGEPRLCRAVGELPRLDRLRQGVHQRRRPRMGPQDARRPARRRRLGGGEGHRRPRPRRHHGRLLRRLCDAGGPRLHAGGVLLRRRHRRPVQPRDAAGDHPALLGGLLREPVPGASAIRAPRPGASCCRSARR